MKTKTKSFRIALFALIAFSTPVLAEDSGRIVEGLKEALDVGIKEAVKTLGAEDGYYKNPGVKILLPEKLKKADKYLDKAGAGKISETLVLKMNRAAEQAAPEAKGIFIDAVKKMKIDDAMNVLSGEQGGAAAYLEDNTAGELKTSFYPIIRSTMEEVNAIKTYNDYLGKLKSSSLGQAGSLLKSTGLTESGPLESVSDIELDLNQYVTDKAIDGLFKTLAKEEVKIRENPEARVTDILKEVFGNILKK